MPRRELYQKNKERNREYNRLYLRKWREKNPANAEVVAKYMREYSKIPAVALKNKARQIVNVQIRKGLLQRQACEIDGCNGVGHAHHEDYSKPLDIVWLCRKHHEAYHHGLTEELTNRKVV
jgi:hypothetical protein